MSLYKEQWLWLVLVACVFLLHMYYYHPYFADDAYISLRYAERLLEGKGLTWNDGEYVEGYSNLLWVLLLAAAGSLGFSPESAMFVLSIGCSLLTLIPLTRHCRDAQFPRLIWIAGLLLFVSLPPVAIWSVSGMETTMVMLCLAWAIILSYRLLDKSSTRDAGFTGVALALICLLRPEGPVYTITLACGLLLCATVPLKPRLRMLFIICAIPFTVFCLQLLLRLHLYGEWVPNTVLAKVAFTIDRVGYGYAYMSKAWFSCLPLLLYILFNATLAKRKEGNTPRVRYIGFLAIVFAVLSIVFAMGGGDFFWGFRIFVPLLPIVILLAMHTFAIGLSYTKPKKEIAFFFYIAAAQIWLQFSVDTNQPVRSWLSTAREIGLTLKEEYGPVDPLLGVHAAGAIPYFSQMRTLDLYGLNSRYLTANRHKNSRFGRKLVGHELFSADYVNLLKPDILVLDIPGFPPLCDSDFKAECDRILSHYRPYTLHLSEQDAVILIRKDSRKIPSP